MRISQVGGVVASVLMAAFSIAARGQTACPEIKIAPMTATPKDGLPPSIDAPKPEDPPCGDLQAMWAKRIINGRCVKVLIGYQSVPGSREAEAGGDNSANVVEWACAVWKKCYGGSLTAPSCEVFLQTIEDAIGRRLTPEEIRAIIECTNCACGGSTPNDPCPVTGDRDCAALVKLITIRLACEQNREPTPGYPRKTNEEVIAQAVCDFYNNCIGGAGGSGGPSSFGTCSGVTPGSITTGCCTGEDACLAMLACVFNNFPSASSPELICKIKQCMSSGNNCMEGIGTAIGAGATPPALTSSYCTPLAQACSNSGPAGWSGAQVGSSDACRNLQFLLVLQEGMWKCETTPPDESTKSQRKARLICAYIAQCMSSANCIDVLSMLTCLLDSGLVPTSTVCYIGSNNGCSADVFNTCAEMLDPGGVRLCLGTWELRSLLELLRCKGQFNNDMTAEQIANLLCKYVGGCEPFYCDQFAGIVRGIFPPSSGEQISVRAENVLAAMLNIGCLDCKEKLILRTRDGKERSPCPDKADPHQKGPNPVLLGYGDKSESVTELTIPTTGGSFTVGRFYDSNPRLKAVAGSPASVSADPNGRTAMVGWNWSMSLFQTAVLDYNGYIRLRARYSDSETIFEHVPSIKKWVATGATDEFFVRASVTIGGVQWSVLRLYRPGNGFVDFIDGYEGPAAPMLIGRILHEQDDYGNSNIYFYSKVNGFASGSSIQPGSTVQYRLATVLLCCKAVSQTEVNPVAPAAVLNLSWTNPITGSGMADFWSATGPFLSKLEVSRLADRGARTPTWIVTERVEYQYLTDTNPSGFVHLGLPGDLIEVRHSTLLNLRDDGEEFGYSPSIGADLSLWKWYGDQYVRATHYRYYTATSLASGAAIDPSLMLGNGASGTDYADMFGWAHQLKLVVKPEQVEYLAATLKDDPEITGTDRLIAGTRVQSDQIDAALDSLWQSSDLSTILLSDMTTTRPVDLAAKVIGYETDHTVTTSPLGTSAKGRVSRQFIQTSCGCGGSSHGTRLDYTYFSGTITSGIHSGRPSFTVREMESVRSMPDGVVGALPASGAYTPYRTMVYDSVFLSSKNLREVDYLVNEVLVEHVTGTSGSIVAPGSSRTWVTSRQFDTGDGHTLLREFSPSAVGSYTAASSGGAFSYTPSSSNGTVIEHTYDSHYQLLTTSIRNGTSGSAGLLRVFEYMPEPAPSSGERWRWWLPKKVTEVRTPNVTTLSGAQTHVTEMVYTFHGTTFPYAIAWRSVKLQMALPSENGPATPTLSTEATFFDSCGRRAMHVSSDRTVTISNYPANDPFGQPNQTRRNPYSPPWDPIPVPTPTPTEPNLGSSFSQNPGGELTTSTQQDAVGRTVATTSPRGVTHYSLQWLFKTPSNEPVWSTGHTSGTFDRQWYRGFIGAPYQWTESSTSKYDGLTSVDVTSATLKTLRMSEFMPDRSKVPSGTYSPLLGQLSINQVIIILSMTIDSREKSRSVSVVHSTGVTEKLRRYSHIPSSGALGLNNVASEERFEYDSLGRVYRHYQPANTGDPQTIRETWYDVRGRAATIRVGRATTGSTLAPEKVAEYIYDDTSGAPGTGDGNLTMMKAYSDGSTSRTSKLYYDWRNRVVARENPLPPHTVTTYDNLDRPLSVSVYSTFTGYPTISSSARLRYSEVAYDERGMRYRERLAVSPTDAAPSAFLETHRWFDVVGRPVAMWGPNGPAVKMQYDAHGRTVVKSVTDRKGDLVPGTTSGGGSSSSYDSAINLIEDNVLEETLTEFDQYGNVKLVTNAFRSHDAAETASATSGSLLANPNAVKTYVGYGYDPADRLIRVVNFGTNVGTSITLGSGSHAIDLGTDVFAKGGAAPSWDSTASPMPDHGTTGYETKIVEAMTYDERGRVATNVDPKGRVTKYFYDDLSRRVAVAESYSTSTVSWNSSSNRWQVSWGTSVAPTPGNPYSSTTNDDYDRVTSTVFDGAGRQVKLIAHLPGVSGEEVQITEYVYGTTNATSDSDIASADLLRQVKYPSTMSGGVSTADVVSYRYNRLGELKHLTDQNGTIHEYTRDGVGRVTLDHVATVGSSGGYSVDGTIRGIGVVFDNAGRMIEVKSLDASNVVQNHVVFEYTDLWQIGNLKQNPIGLVNGTAADERAMEFTYETVAFGTGTGVKNYSRLGNVVQPTGEMTVMSYGDLFASNVDGRIHRQTGIENNVSKYGAKYSYLGLSIPAVVDYHEADIQLDRTIDRTGHRRASGTSSQVDGVYPGFDRFGRLKRQVWVYGDVKETTNSARRMNRPALVELEYSYDKASNRTEKNDITQQYTTNINRSEGYVYDRLNRLREVQTGRGTMTPGSQNSTVTFTPISGSTNWVLDQTGNWLATRKDLGGTPATPPAYGNTNDTVDDRTHNASNATNQISSSAVTVVGGGAPPTVPFVYDGAGNLIKKGPPSGGGGGGDPNTKYTYDAWNRLVKVEKYDAGVSAYKSVNEFSYNGLHWRVRVQESSVLNVRPGDVSGVTGLDRDRLIYFDPSWRAVAERVDLTGDYDYNDETADTLWGLTYIDEAIASRRTGGGGSIDKADVLYHLYDAQYSVVGRVLDDGDAMPRLVERIVYSVYGEPTAYPYSYADCADVNGNPGPDGQLTNEDDVQFSAWYSGSDIRADIADDLAVVPMDLANNSGVTSDDQLAFYIEYMANIGTISPVQGAVSQPRTMWSGGGGPTGTSADTAISDIGYCGYAWNPGSGQYSVRFRNYDPELGRWLQRDPAGYVDGMGVYEYGVSEPATSIDPLGLDVGWAKRPGNDPYGELLGCEIRINLDWRGSWTEVEKSRFRLALERSKHRAKQLIEEIDNIKTTLSRCVAQELDSEISELNAFRRRMIMLIDFLNSHANVKIYQGELGKDAEAQTQGYRYYYGQLIYAYVMVNNSANPQHPCWVRENTDGLAALLLHEFSHIVEGPWDYDKSEFLYNLNLINIKGGIYDVGVEKSQRFQFILSRAKRKCDEKDCHQGKSNK